MRKSERLRLLEMQVLAMEFKLDLMDQYLSVLIKNMEDSKIDLDSGKWYQRRPDSNS
jgi:hypothetical protein